MDTTENFDLAEFLPYLLNMAAEQAGRGFQKYYKARYGMVRTEWRVVYHLGLGGDMTARDICNRARTHKTKVSRAVAALEARLGLAALAVGAVLSGAGKRRARSRRSRAA